MQQYKSRTAWGPTIRRIEKLAVEHHITMQEAAKVFLATPSNEPMIKEAMGNRWSGTPPKIDTVMRYKDPYKLTLARRWPKLTRDELAKAAPYLPPNRRTLPRNAEDKAKEMWAFGLPAWTIALFLEMSLSKVYSLKPRREKWQTAARALKDKGWKNADIAKNLGVSLSSVSHLKPDV